MIKNKEITIIKKNDFDCYWALFAKNDVLKFRNNEPLIDLSALIKSITFADEINLILCDCNLPRKVIEELIWVSDYIKINIIAKNNSIINSLRNINFGMKKVDETINFDFIHAYGRRGEYDCIFNQDFLKADKAINSIYFGEDYSNNKLNVFDNLKSLYFLGEFDKQIFDNCINNNVDLNYINIVENFTKQTYEFAQNNNLNLYISEQLNKNVIGLTKDNKLVKVLKLKNDLYSLLYINNGDDLIANIYSHCDEFSEKDELKFYLCLEKKLTPFEINPVKVERITKKIPTIKDFICEKFDSSIVDKHNDYCRESLSVKYIFTLVPPSIDDDFERSKIYFKFDNIFNKFNKLDKNIIFSIFDQFKTINLKSVIFEDFIIRLKKFTNEINSLEKKCFLNYRQIFEQYISYLNNFSINAFCKEIFDDMSNKNSSKKFDKFDDEIAGYKNTIKEKQALIDKKENVLANKRRIELLNNKINNLERLKNEFQKNNTDRFNKFEKEFLDFCNLILSGKGLSENDDSLGNIVLTKDQSSEKKLQKFMINNLQTIKDFIFKLLNTLEGALDVDIPEKYIVYEKDGEKYIAIDELEDYKFTEDIRKKYNLMCLARK